MSIPARVFIFGSYITAMVMETDRLPQAGETLTARHFRQTHGGKGSNMAVQAARLGADVTFAGVIGNDASGDQFLATLAVEGIHVRAIRRTSIAPTGTGFIVVDSQGRNVIMIDSGANLEFTAANDFNRLKPFLDGCGTALAQCEIPLSTALEGLAAAKAAGAITILNPAPASDLAGFDLSWIDYLTPNETEAKLCLGLGPFGGDQRGRVGQPPAGAGRRLSHLHARASEARCSSRRITALNSRRFPLRCETPSERGDSFNAAFATALAEGRDEASSLRFACAAASLSTTRCDTLASYHRRSEVDQFL